MMRRVFRTVNPTPRLLRGNGISWNAMMLSVLAAMTTLAAPDPTLFDIPRLEHIAIDGDTADWEKGGGGFRVDLLLPVQAQLPDRAEFSAGMRLGWDDDGLLVLVTVTGRDWSEADKLEELWKRDSVELLMAPAAGSPDNCQWLVAPGMDVRFPEPRTHLHDHRQSPVARTNLAAITVGRVRTASGYRIETRLPWSALGIQPHIDREVAFQVMVNRHERDHQPQDHLVWFPQFGAFEDTRKMHRLRLSETSHPPVVARAVGLMNYRESRTEFKVFGFAERAGQAVQVRAAGSVLASGQLRADTNGYACATLTGPPSEEVVAFLEINGQPCDIVPLALPAGLNPARAWSIDTPVRFEHSRLALVMNLPPTSVPLYTVARREPGQMWRELARDVSPGDFRDAGVEEGKVYEYAVVHPGRSPAVDYFCAGHAVPLVDQRGTVLLLVEQSLAGPLAAEIRRLMFDLVGDGWQVIRRDVGSHQSPGDVRQIILAEHGRAPAALNTVFLLGHVPVPYSGNLGPDGHPDHVGAWPADVYYGALEGPWTDTTVTNTANGRQGNVPGDGKFDQSTIPGGVQLAVGRVDFHAMPAFNEGETTLLRRYLDRDHAYRQGVMTVLSRGMIQDHFIGHVERFAYSGWQNLTTLLGPENIRIAEWPNVRPDMHLWFYGCGGGGFGSMAGFGETQTLAKIPLNAVFTLLFGSYFADWDVPNNLMRAALASDGGALTCGWAGRPHWYLHPMAMGATIGDCLRLTQNNAGDAYQPIGTHARGVHIALLGDPTLRMHRVLPPGELCASPALEGMRLNWRPSAQAGVSYHVYRSKGEFGPYERLTPEPVSECTFLDREGAPVHHYLVRAVATQVTPTGSYDNASQGVFH